MTVASYGGRKLSSIREAQVVIWPRSQRISFTAIGNPASRPTACRFAPLAVNLCRLPQRAIGIHPQERANAAIDRLDAVEICPHKLDRGDCARFEVTQMLGGSLLEKGHGGRSSALNGSRDARGRVCFVPEGRRENSPAVHCWEPNDNVSKNESRRDD